MADQSAPLIRTAAGGIHSIPSPARRKPKPNPILSFSPGSVWVAPVRWLPTLSARASEHPQQASTAARCRAPFLALAVRRRACPTPNALSSARRATSPRVTPTSPQFTARAAVQATHTTMAPAAMGVGSSAAALVSKGYSYSKAAARSVWLGLPALPPPVPGLRLAAQGQTRAASSLCKGLERSVEAMATGEPAAAPVAENEELTEFVNALKQEWDRIEDKYAVTTLAVAAVLGMWSAGGVVSAIDRLPLIPGLMEAIGIGYSGWFAYRNLLFKPDRDAFFAKVREIYEDIISA